MKEFKIRASAIGEIMGGFIGLTDIQKAKLSELEARNNDVNAKPLTANMKAELDSLVHKRDNPELPAGAKTYCQKWLKEQIYGKKKEFTSKFTDKGNAVEPIAFRMISEHLDIPVTKNDELFENDYIQGVPDILGTHLIDAKSSWDCFLFPLFESETESDSNYWQAQGYMDITDRADCMFIYVLCNTPDNIVNREARNYCYNNGFEVIPEVVEAVREQLTYDNVADKYKIRVFNIVRNDNDIKSIYERVRLCREYIKTIIK